MASSRKKQDEKNLKTLRELGALPQNKYCFDCNQRGPTYVNVTIGSFVCTKCSGMLRGITPPHRVKSISMATFTSEEIDLLKNRGNDYCQKVWLGLYEGAPPSASGDEQAIRDFMVEKYERRRYYLDPALNHSEVPNTRPPVSNPKPVKMNGVNGSSTVQSHSTHRTRPEVNKNNINNNNNAIFVADFDKADIFSSTANGNLQTQQNGGGASFANFDNNPVFSNTSTNSTTTAGMPTTATFNNTSNWNNQQNNTSNSLNGSLNSSHNGQLAPLQDKYAALKDLDNEIKSQKTLEWSSTGSNGSLYSSPTPTGSMYSSPSPQSSIFGSPSQGQFLSAFPVPQENGTTSVSNPFSNGGGVNWGANLNGFQQTQQPFANPFRDANKMNGFSQVFQPISAFPVNTVPVAINGTGGWAPNPFKVGAAANTNSNNPFL